MKSVLYVALPAAPDGQLQIAREHGDRLEVIHHRGPFGAVDCIAFAPATMVGHFRVSIPSRNEIEASRAALYAIEDELAQPVEDIHLVLGPRSKGSSERDIYVVDKQLMKSWLDLLSKAGLSPGRVFPEQCLFTDIEHPVDLGDRIIQREGNRIVGIDAALPKDARDVFSAPSDMAGLEDGLHLIRLAERSATRTGTNLRTGIFSLPRNAKQGVSTWRKAAGIGIAAVSVWTGTLILEARNYNYATELLNKRAVERYAAIFPAAAIPPDIDRETRDMLAAVSAPDTIDFRISVATLYEAIASRSGVSITELNFDAQTSRLTAALNSPSQDDTSLIVAFLQSGGFQAAATTSAQDTGTLTQITLEPVP